MGPNPAEVVGLIGSLGHVTGPGGEGAGSIAAGFDPVKPDANPVRHLIRGSMDRELRSREFGKPAWQANLRAHDRANSLLLRAGSTSGPTRFRFLEQFQEDQILRAHASATWRLCRIQVSIKKLMNSKHL
jgi:hypothetical protein